MNKNLGNDTLHNISRESFLINQDDNISWIIYIASLTENIVNSHDLEIASEIFSSSYKALFENDLTVFQEILRKNGNSDIMTVLNYKVTVADSWLFQVIILNSIKDFDILPMNSKYVDSHQSESLIYLVECIIDKIDVVRQNSLFLLRTLQIILKRCDILTPNLSFNILKCMDKVALSPITGFKQLAHGISKTAIHFLTQEQQQMIYNIDILPLRGIESFELLKLLPDDQIKKNIEVIIKKVLKMFDNIIENKDGGFLYGKLLICGFDEWKSKVWPLFLQKLIRIGYASEFHQSLIKYWIPSSVVAYRSDFYAFLENQPIGSQLKACILLESRKRGYPLRADNHFLYNIATRTLGLKLATSYRKKSLCPEKNNINAVMDFLYSNLKQFLEDDEVKSLNLLFSQLFFFAHNDLKKNCNNLKFYTDFVNEIYKFCYGSLNSEFFEVGAQVLQVLRITLTGSHKDLTLLYKLEKKDAYERGENLLYKKLKSDNLWSYESEFMMSRIKLCFEKNDFYSLILTNLIMQLHPNNTIVDMNIFKKVLARVENLPTLQNTEKIINLSNIIFHKGYSKETENFLKEITVTLQTNLSSDLNENMLFRSVLYLEILTSARRHKLKVENLEILMEKAFTLIDSILDTDYVENASYTSRKVLESFISRVMFCIMQDLNALWTNLDIMAIIGTLNKIINKSNMKKPVSLSVEVLRQFGFIMEENEKDKILKIKLLDHTLRAIHETFSRQDLKMRRNPESRLVVHAMCVSEKLPDKPLLKWTFDYLLKLISDPHSSDFTVSSALHTIELLISDNRLQQQTLPYIPSVIVECVEIFKKPSWIVRNADLQLAKSLIERMYGVSLCYFNRTKSVEDLFLIYPNLSTYFYRILSADVLDERSVIVFHFFLESQVKQSIFHDSIQDILGYFHMLFVHIIKNYENHYGRLAVRSYVALCHAEIIPKVMHNVAEFIMKAYVVMKKNVFANCVFLLQELYEKYENSFEHYAKPSEMTGIGSTMENLCVHLRKFNVKLYDFLSLKVTFTREIIESLEDNLENRLWLNNNVPFLIKSTPSNNMCNILERILARPLPSFVQVKMLSILVQKFENNEFANEDLRHILQVLFKKSVSIDNSDSYLLNCYFKVILLIMQTNDVVLSLDLVDFESSSLYKCMIYVLYVSATKFVPNKTLADIYQVVERKYIASFGMNEEIDNDIISTFVYCIENSPKSFRLKLCKMVLYFSQFQSTHLETYHFISRFKGKSYTSVLCALKDFLMLDSISEFLGDERYVKLFFERVSGYLDEECESVEINDDFYTVEGDELIPKIFLRKLLFQNLIKHE